MCRAEIEGRINDLAFHRPYICAACLDKPAGAPCACCGGSGGHGCVCRPETYVACPVGGENGANSN